MSKKSLVMCVSLFFFVSQALSARVRKHSANSTAASTVTAFNCHDLCVACRDGSTVFFGRNSNWWKAVPSIVLGGVGFAAATSGVGLVGVGAAAAAGAVIGVGTTEKTGKETNNHWTGNLPTSGVFCERVDVIMKRPRYQPEAWMSAAKTRLGRVQNNNLKPYGADGEPRTDIVYAPYDVEAYDEGCKIVKGAGLYGKWGQLKSIGTNWTAIRNWDLRCDSMVTQGTMTCAAHSKLCGKAGVQGVLETSDYSSCMDPGSAYEIQRRLKCPKIS